MVSQHPLERGRIIEGHLPFCDSMKQAVNERAKDFESKVNFLRGVFNTRRKRSTQYNIIIWDASSEPQYRFPIILGRSTLKGWLLDIGDLKAAPHSWQIF
jgi:hypothetical protein